MDYKMMLDYMCQYAVFKVFLTSEYPKTMKNSRILTLLVDFFGQFDQINLSSTIFIF